MRLLRSELLRARSRRSVLALALAGVVLTVALAAVTAWNERPYDAAETSQAQDRASNEIARCKKHSERAEDPVECAERVTEWFYQRMRDTVDDGYVEDTTVTLTLSLMMIGALLGATFVGGEFSSGSISNLLLFEPRRLRVWATKLAATGLLTLVWAALCVGGFVAGLTALGRSWDSQAWGSHWLSAMVNLGARNALAVAGAAVVGAALALAVRSTLACISVVIGYLVIEGVAVIAFTNQVAEYALSSRLLGVLSGSHLVEVEDGNRIRQVAVTLQDSALMLLGVFLVLCIVSASMFRRRDID